MDKNKKEKIVVSLREKLERASGVFLVDYKGLDVETLTKLRQDLREVDVEFQVVKNTLLALASRNTGTAALKEYMSGPCALALTYDDIVSPAKVLTKFAHDNDKVEVKAGQLNGSVIEFPDIKRLAMLPAREVLLSQVVFSLASVPTAFVRVLSEVQRSLLNVLNAIKKQKA